MGVRGNTFTWHMSLLACSHMIKINLPQPKGKTNPLRKSPCLRDCWQHRWPLVKSQGIPVPLPGFPSLPMSVHFPEPTVLGQQPAQQGKLHFNGNGSMLNASVPRGEDSQHHLRAFLGKILTTLILVHYRRSAVSAPSMWSCAGACYGLLLTTEDVPSSPSPPNA